MYDEPEEEKKEKDETHICPICKIRRPGKVCPDCNIVLEDEPEEDPEKRKEDEYDEYDWRERR